VAGAAASPSPDRIRLGGADTNASWVRPVVAASGNAACGSACADSGPGGGSLPGGGSSGDCQLPLPPCARSERSKGEVFAPVGSTLTRRGVNGAAAGAAEAVGLSWRLSESSTDPVVSFSVGLLRLNRKRLRSTQRLYKSAAARSATKAVTKPIVTLFPTLAPPSPCSDDSSGGGVSEGIDGGSDSTDEFDGDGAGDSGGTGRVGGAGDGGGGDEENAGDGGPGSGGTSDCCGGNSGGGCKGWFGVGNCSGSDGSGGDIGGGSSGGRGGGGEGAGKIGGGGIGGGGMGGGGDGDGGVGGGGIGGGESTTHELSSRVAVESKFDAPGNMHPSTNTMNRHEELFGTLTSEAKL